jgi:glycosyltransferase involved in cell wall biosynthesis
MAKKLLIEGWRGINHSYAMVNQYQLLELKKQPIELYHHDAPFYKKNWSLSQNFCGFNSISFQEIGSIPALPANIKADIIYRISYPFNLTIASSQALFVYGTTEYQNLSREMFYVDDGSVAYKNFPVTIVTPSNWSKEGFLKVGFRENQVKVVPHGVDLSVFKPISSELRNQYRGLLGAGGESFVILTVGAMTKNKGVDILLDVYIRLKKRHPNIKLVLKDQSNLYGFSANELVSIYCKEKNIDPTTKDMVDAISGIVCITENLDLNQLNGLYNAADCYASPYRAEGFNLPPLEAASSGCPIIVTKGGSTDDYVDPSFAFTIESKKKHHDGNCFLEVDIESLEEQIESLIHQKMSSLNVEIARQFLLKNFSWEAVCNKLTHSMGLL